MFTETWQDCEKSAQKYLIKILEPFAPCAFQKVIFK